jgi:hypothetical protein
MVREADRMERVLSTWDMMCLETGVRRHAWSSSMETTGSNVFMGLRWREVDV